MREKNDSSAEHGGMRKAKMPAKEFERNVGELGQTCKIKYATEFGNPESLNKMSEGLASYTRKNKMKYE